MPPGNQQQEQYRELQLRRQQDNRNDTVIGTEQANAEKKTERMTN